jgi:hypothetical protein
LETGVGDREEAVVEAATGGERKSFEKVAGSGGREQQPATQARLLEDGI